MTIYLYIKQHSVTGLKYFGMTRRCNPHKYMGSGSYWKRHIAKHGKEFVKTINLWKFDDQEMCTDFALSFSKNNNIVESKEWANLQEENALDGASKGKKLSEETRKKISMSLSGSSRPKHSEETKMKIGIAAKGKKLSEETKMKMSIAASGRKSKNLSEEHKKKLGAAMTRYHGNKCVMRS